MRGSTAAVLLACLGASLVLGAAARSARVPAPTFAPAKNYAAGAGGTGLGGSVAVGDLNGDGTVDLVTSNGLADGGIAVLLNRGRGTFGRRVVYGAGNMRSVAIGDLDRDGVNDVAAVNYSRTVSVFLNRGNGTYPRERRYRSAGETDIAVGDLNGDGSPDIVTANQKARSVSVLLNRGDGSFEPKVDYHVARGPLAVTLGDLNGDKRNDVATGNCVDVPRSSTVSVLLGRGDGTLYARRDYRLTRDEACPHSLGIGDLNSDRRPDLAVAPTHLLLNRGHGTFARARSFWGVGSVAIGDLNGDSKLDVAGAGLESVTVLLNSGDARLQAPLDYLAAGADDVAIADFNGDRRPDLVAATLDRVSVLLNKPGVCDVQRLLEVTLTAAKRQLARVNCRIGKVRRTFSRTIGRGRVMSQTPAFGAVRSAGSKVNIVVSKGRRR